MFSYRGRRVYDGLNMELRDGAVYGLLGRNGAGKTTLMRLIAGLLDCNSGRITVNGMTPFRRDPVFLNSIYFVPESFNAPEMRVSDYAATYGAFYSNYDGDAFTDYMKALSVDPETAFRRLSFGQRKKALMAFALSLKTDILLLDEPGNGLDIPSKLTLRHILSECASPSRTIIMSTHQVRDIEDIVDHVAIIDGGRLLLDASTREIDCLVQFVESPQADADALFSERTAGGFVNIKARRNCSIDRTHNRMDMEVLFNACVTGGRNFVSSMMNRNKKEVSYVL